jgi:geranylgeranyl diphosphate synthase type II
MLKQTLEEGRRLADAALERLLPPAAEHPAIIHRAMRHSVFAGGKRLRPILAMEGARLIAGALPEGVEELGAALEMLHTYSLIHDDLPALDNDDLRRGQPTCHKAFGEAMAILAGDALQTRAYEVLARLHCTPERRVRIIEEIARATGGRRHDGATGARYLTARRRTVSVAAAARRASARSGPGAAG